MNTQTAPTKTREEIISGLLAARARLQAEGVIGGGQHQQAPAAVPQSQSAPAIGYANAVAEPEATVPETPHPTPEPSLPATDVHDSVVQLDAQGAPVAPRVPTGSSPAEQPEGQPSPYAVPEQTASQSAPPAGAADSVSVAGGDPYREPIEDTPAPEPTPEPVLVEEPAVQQETQYAPPLDAEVPQADMTPETAVEEAPGSQPEPQIPDPSAVPAQAPAADSVLMDPEVQKGLEQLLSEWDIFKSSGLFGFGGSGIDHPTYKKISQLPVMAVVSGRWEGADPTVSQNIKEYMEGWEHEQGITADPEETFETYLRRVIAHILNIG